jgi:hypothetical protein
MKSNDDPLGELPVNLPDLDPVDLSDDEWSAWQYVLDELPAEQVRVWELRLEQELELQMLVARVVQELSLCQASFGAAPSATAAGANAGTNLPQIDSLPTPEVSRERPALAVALKDSLPRAESRGVVSDESGGFTPRANTFARARWMALAAGVLALLGGVSWWFLFEPTNGSSSSVLARDSDRDELSFSWFEMWLEGDSGGDVTGDLAPAWDLTLPDADDRLQANPLVAELATDSPLETESADHDPAGNWLLLAVITLEEGEADDETWQ